MIEMEERADGIRCNKTKEGSIAATRVRLRSTGRKWRARVTMFLEESRSPTDDRLIIDVIIFARTTLGLMAARAKTILCASWVWQRLFSDQHLYG